MNIVPNVFVPLTIALERKIRASSSTAKMICHGYEDTIECKLAWEKVDDLKKGLRKIKDREEKKPLMCEIDPLACREYDV